LGVHHRLIFPIDTVAVWPATQKKIRRHIVELHAHRHALCQAVKQSSDRSRHRCFVAVG
jgi:hypothetical protein